MIYIAVEGESDREAAIAVARVAGHDVAHVYVAGGKTKLDAKIAKYNAASRGVSWVVFRDSDGQCPVELRRHLTAGIFSWSPRFALRIAHSMTEAWLMADKEGFAGFFHVRPSRLPLHPESVEHAKRTLLDLCLASSSRTIRRDVVTADGKTGPLYVVRINEFASRRWDVNAAAENSPSLARALESIRSLP